MMSLRTYITNGQQIRSRDLALNGEFVVFRVRRFIFVVERGRTANRAIRSQEVDQRGIRADCRCRCTRIGGRVASREVIWRGGDRKEVQNGVACRPVGERSSKVRRTLAGKVSKRGVSNFIKIRGALEGRIELTIAKPDARGAGLSKNLTERALVVTERI